MRMEPSNGEWRATRIIASSSAVANPLVGLTVGISGGRRVGATRRADLRLRDATEEVSSFGDHLISLDIHRRKDQITISSEATMRRPLSQWPLPALRTVKLVHQRIKLSSEALTFAHADPAHAIALQVALQDALWPLVEQGILSGSADGGPPDVQGGVEVSPGSPSLTAKLTAQLIPWQREVQVRVSLNPGSQPTIEVS